MTARMTQGIGKTGSPGITQEVEMSMEAVARFRQAIQASTAMQQEIQSLADGGTFDPVAFGQQHGLGFTRAELAEALENLKGQLSEFEIALMARIRRGSAALKDLEPRSAVVGGVGPSQPLSKSTAQAY